MMTNQYNKLSVLKGLEAVRKKPTMYAHSINRVTEEILQNSIDELQAGHGTTIVAIVDGNSFVVIDDGRGIPVDFDKDENMYGVDIASTVLHGTGKLDNSSENSNYKYSGGTNGVGLSVVNAFSSNMDIVVSRNKKYHMFSYKDGNFNIDSETNSHYSIIKKDSLTNILEVLPTFKDHGTLISWSFNNETIKPLLDDITVEELLNFEYFSDLMNFYACLLEKRMVLIFNGEVFEYEGKTIKDLIPNSSESILSLVSDPNSDNSRLVLGFNNLPNKTYRFFTNHIETKQGGTYYTGFKKGIVPAIKSILQENPVINSQFLRTVKGYKELLEKMTSDYFSQYLDIIIDYKVTTPLYEGNSKVKIKNPEAEKIYIALTKEAIREMFYPSNAKSKAALELLMKLAAAEFVHEKSRKNMVTIKSEASNVFSNSGKLVKCQSTNPEECELFIIEGDSALGSARSGRIKHNQALFPLKGKIENVFDLDLENPDKFSTEITSLISSLECGYGKKFNIDKLRYHKIIIMADSDDDGC